MAAQLDGADDATIALGNNEVGPVKSERLQPLSTRERTNLLLVAFRCGPDRYRHTGLVMLERTLYDDPARCMFRPEQIARCFINILDPSGFDRYVRIAPGASAKRC